jgi:hypothetical protein
MKKKSKRRRKFENCRWLRDHSSVMKPEKAERFKDREGKVYWYLSTGQVVNEYNLRRMGL